MSQHPLIGRLEIVPVREAFRREAHDFTRWLEEHIDALAERVGIELRVVQREKQVGEFKVDLFCESQDARLVIIENQLERTNHDHLGKLLTYLVNLEATAAIWLTTDARPEHEEVVQWLNQVAGTTTSFYLVKVEATRIGNSPYAPLFTVIARPDEQTKEIGVSKKEWAERHHQRLEFWKGLLERGKSRTPLFGNISPSRDHWLNTGAGRSGLVYSYSILMDRSVVELYIDMGGDDSAPTKRIFDQLHAQRAEIEQEFGSPLEWMRLDERRASRVVKTVTNEGLKAQDRWPVIQDALIDTMIRFERMFRPRIQKLRMSP